MAMTPCELKRISDLWDVLAELPIGEREQWLCAVGADDAAHVPALRDMLRRRDGTADGLSLGAPAIADDSQPSQDGIHQPGDHVGSFRLLRFLGRGGMAEVWLARREDGPMDREVALKLPLTLAKHRMLRQRFDRECAILSALSHPHIARLYDAGVSTDGQPFMALEYVKGDPMPAYCDARVLPVSARVSLMLQLLGAVHHAHTQLVIHRDIKPANIMVTGDGTVRLLDFGIAKLLSEDELATGQAATALTHIGGSALTLDYASPEQVLQQPVGTASDVYSLGVVLFELLCGVRPYALRRNDRRALEAAILADERPSPSSCVTASTAAARGVTARSLQRLLRGDLDTIVAKALRVRAADRYASVAAFADDLQRWLRHETILARPVSATYTAWRFAQRHWLPLTAAAAVASALLAGTAVSMQQAQRAQVQELLARQEASRAQMVSKFMEDVFSANGRGGQDVKAAGQRTARELLDRGVNKLETDATVTDVIRFELLGTFASIYVSMGILDVSLRLSEQRSEVAIRAFGPNSLESIHALIDVAGKLGPMGRRDASIQTLNRARLLLTRIDLDTEPVATAWLSLANVMADAGARGDAPEGLDAVQIGRKWLNRSNNTTAKIAFLTNGAVVLLRRGQLDVALNDLRQAMALHDSLGPTHKASGYTVETWLGNAELSNGNLEEAKRRFESAIRTVETAPAAYEDQWVRQGMWRWYDVTGQLENAFAVSQQSIRQLEAQTENFSSSETATPYIVHSKAAWRSGRIEVALQSLERAEVIDRKAAKMEGSDEPLRAHRLRDQNPIWWVGANLVRGRLTDARLLLDRERQNIAAELQSVSSSSINYHLLAIELALASGDSLQARQAVDDMKRLPLNPRTVPIYRLWSLQILEAKTLALEGQMQQAEAALLGLLAAIESRNDAHHWADHAAPARLALGEVLMATGRASEARPVFSAAASTFATHQSPELSLDLARSLDALARADAAVNDVTSSRIHAGQAKAIWARHPSLPRGPRVAAK